MPKIKIKRISSIKTLPVKPVHLVSKTGAAYIRRQHYRVSGPSLIPKSKKIKIANIDKINKQRDNLENNPIFDTNKGKEKALNLLDKQQNILENEHGVSIRRNVLNDDLGILKNIPDSHIDSEIIQNLKSGISKKEVTNVLDDGFLNHGFSISNKRPLTANDKAKIEELKIKAYDDVDKAAELGEYIYAGTQDIARNILKQAKSNGYTSNDTLSLLSVSNNKNTGAINNFVDRLKEILEEKGHTVSTGKISLVNDKKTKRNIFSILSKPDINITQLDLPAHSKAIILQDNLSDEGTLLDVKHTLQDKNLNVVGSYALSKNKFTPINDIKTKKLRQNMAGTKNSDLLNSVLLQKHGIGISSMTHNELTILSSFLNKIKKEKSMAKKEAYIVGAKILKNYDNKNQTLLLNNKKTKEITQQKIELEDTKIEEKMITSQLKAFAKGAQFGRVIRKAKRGIRHDFTRMPTKITTTNNKDQNQDKDNEED